MLASDATLDDIIDRLLEAKNGRPGKPVQLAENEVRQLCLTAKDLFMSQANLLELEAPIKICGEYGTGMRQVVSYARTIVDSISHLAGDIHGQYSDLLRLFEYGGFPPEANYLFLGDYVDRGKQSLETICLLLAYKVVLNWILHISVETQWESYIDWWKSIGPYLCHQPQYVCLYSMIVSRQLFTV